MLVDINLLPNKEKERSTLYIVAFAIIGGAMLLALVLWLLGTQTDKQTVILEEELARLMLSEAELRASLQMSESTTAEQQLVATVEWAEDYRFETVSLIEQLVERLPERGFFDSFEFTGPNTALLDIQFDTPNDAAHYNRRLQLSEQIASAALISITSRTPGDDSITSQFVPRYVATYELSFVDNRLLIEMKDDESTSDYDLLGEEALNE